MLIVGFIVIQTILFLVIFFALRRMLIKNTASAVNRLKLTDEENVKRLAAIKKEIEGLEAEHRQKQSALPLELDGRREEAKKKLDEEKSRIITEARQEGRRILDVAKSRKDKTDQELDKDLQKRAMALAGTIVQKMLSETLKSGLNEKLVNELFLEVERMEMGHVPDSTREVEIIVPEPLKGEQKSRLKVVIEKKLARPIGIRETIRKEMSGGLILNVGSLVVDGSLENLIQGVAERMRTQT